MIYLRFFSFIIFCALTSFEFIFATSVDGTSNIQYLTSNHVLRNNEFARGYVKFNDGATILSDATAFFNIISPFSGPLDLRGTGTLALEGNLILDVNATLSGSGVIRGNGNTIFLDGNFTISKDSVIHINSDTIVDGKGHKLIFENRGRIFVDTNITLTLQNMEIIQNLNDYTDPCIRLAAFKSRLALKNVKLALSQDFLFPNGQLFIHGDVVVTGTSAFIYKSTQKSLIAQDSTFYFDKGTTFSVVPATITDCKFDQWPTYTSNNFITMQDETSRLYFNQSTLCSTPTGCRFTKGTINFENECNIKSNTSLNFALPEINPPTLYGTTQNIPSSISWTHDGNFIAAVNKGSNSIQIFNADTLAEQVSGNTFESPSSVDWSNGRYAYFDPSQKILAVTNEKSNLFQFYVFTSAAIDQLENTYTYYPYSISWNYSANYFAVISKAASILSVYEYANPSTLRASIPTAETPSSVSWYEYGELTPIAVVSSFYNKLQLFRFDGSDLSFMGENSTDSNPSSVSWSSFGQYIGVVNYDSDTLQVFRYDQYSDPVVRSIASISTDMRPSCLAWSLVGDYIAVVNSQSNTLQVFQFISESLSYVGTSVSTGLNPTSVQWSQDANFLALVNKDSNTLQIFSFDPYNPNTPVKIGTDITTGDSPRSVSWIQDPYTGLYKISVVNYNSNTLQIFLFDGINTPEQFGTNINVATHPTCVTWRRDSYLGTNLLTANEDSGILHNFYISFNSLIEGYNRLTDDAPSAIKWSPDGRFIAITNKTSNTLEVFDFYSGDLLARIATGSGPISLSWAPGGKLISVANSYDETIQIFEFNFLNSLSLVASAGTDKTPSSISWSPDGVFIALVNQNSDTLQVFSLDTAKNLELVNRAKTDSQPVGVSWNFDGSMISVINSNSDTVQLFPFNRQNLVDQVGANVFTATYPNSVSWSYDENFIAVACGDSGPSDKLQVYSFDGLNTPVQVGSDALTEAHPHLAWSPVDYFIAVVNEHSNTLQIFSFDGINTPVLVGSSVPTDMAPVTVSWSNDGNFLVVANKSSNSLQIFTFDGISSPTLVTSASTTYEPCSVAWSPAGNFIAVVNYVYIPMTEYSNFQIFSFDGSNLTSVGVDTGLNREPTSIAWSPDGQYLAVSITYNYFQIYSFDGLTVETVGNYVGTPNFISSISWSSDGRFIALTNRYIKSASIYTFDGKNTPILSFCDASTYGFDTQSISWSPTSKFLAVIGRDPSVLQILLPKIFNTPVENISRQSTNKSPKALSWAPDGSSIAVANSASNNIQKFPYQTFDMVSHVGSKVTLDFIPQAISWSPDGRFVGVIGNKFKVYSFDGVNTPTQIGSSIDIFDAKNIAWSPDGKFIAVVTGFGGWVNVYSFDGIHTPTLFSQASVFVGFHLAVTWSPDGNFIALVDYAYGLLRIYYFNRSGAAPTQVGTAPIIYNPYALSWSPDGRFIAVVSSRLSFALEIFSFSEEHPSDPILVGHEATTGGNPSSVEWSKDSRFVSVVNQYGRSLQVFEFNGIDTPILLGSGAPLVARGGTGAWSQDGKFISVACMGSGDYPLTLQMYSFDGNSTPISIGTKNISNQAAFTTGRPSLAWSLDGRFIAITETQDVIGEGTNFQILKLNYVPDKSVQAISNGIGFGNSSLGQNFDATVNVLAGANVNVNGLINYDCVN